MGCTQITSLLLFSIYSIRALCHDFRITLSIFINCFLFQYRSNASLYSLFRLSCGIFFSTTVSATISPSNNFELYSSALSSIDLITNSLLMGVDLVETVVEKKIPQAH